jgi:ribonucleoside-diphosphate reductase alpha chain
VFDCAFPTTPAGRSIHYEGHIRMVAAVQPFLSGSASKTINMPNSSTVEDIENAYLLGWKLGCKSLAIYRDGCKATQVLTTQSQDSAPATVPVPGAGSSTVAVPYRRRLPDERAALTHKATIANHEFYVTIGLFDDGTPGEIFLRMAKEGSTISGLMDAFATSISMALQYGVPLQALCDKFRHSRFEPAGFTKHPEIRIATSITDYLFRYLALKFLDQEPAPVSAEALYPGAMQALVSESGASVTYGTGICSECGGLLRVTGNCAVCTSCGTSMGCS